MLLVKNKRASFDYRIESTHLAGIELTGAEVKSLRLKHASLAGSYVKALAPQGKNELFLLNAQINPYPFAGRNQDYDPKRTRKLLLKRSEIEQLVAVSQQKSRSLVPLAFVLEHNRIKLELAVGVGKKAFEKRAALRRKDLERELAGKLKRQQFKI